MKNFYKLASKAFSKCNIILPAFTLVLTGIFQPGHLFAQAPIVSYNSPQTYTINVAITALSPTSSGVAAIGYNGAPVSLGSGFNSPTSVAVDATGSIYTADQGNSLVKKMPAGGGTPVTIGTGFNHPYGVAVDAAGNVYVADEGNNAVKEILASNGSTVTIGSGFSNPSGVAVDAAGNVYVADYGNNAVKKIPAGNGTPVTMGGGFSVPTSVAVDAAGNVYVADYGHSAIKEILVSNGSTIALGSGFNAPAGVTVDASGNVYIADTGNNLVKELPAGGGAQLTLGSGFASPYGVAADGAGNVYVADENHNAVKEINPIGGYYISSALPLGLSFNNNTGVISGTSTVLSAAKNYVVTAYNSTASKQATINITVNPPPLPTIHYSTPQVYTVSVAITPLAPTTTGTINSFSVNPALPAGLSFNTSTGVISGTPTGTSSAANYTVSAQNPGGTATATINITVNNPPRPTISYGGAQTYLANAAITPLTPASTWVSAPGYKNAVSVSQGFFNKPEGVASDAAGNLYVADEGTGSIRKVSADGTTSSTIASGFSSPNGIAADTKGNVYVSDWNNNAVYKIAPGGGPAVIATGFNNPGPLAVDAAGNVYVSDENNRAVKKIPAGGGATVTLGSGFVFPHGLAVDVSGNVYVAISETYNNPMQNAVYKIPFDGGPLSLFLDYGIGTNEWGNPDGVAQDGNGNFYMSDGLYDRVLKYPSTGGNTSSATVLPASGDLSTMAVGGNGSVYVAYYFDNAVEVMRPFGGYFITPALPPGMHFDGTTGTISGTPTVTSPATTYTITGYNVGAGTSTTISIAVNAPPVPTVSYSAASSYIAGRAVPPINPASTNVDLQGYNIGTPVAVGSGFSAPAGLGLDGAGNVYVADAGNNAVKKMPAGGGTPVAIGSGFSSPSGVTADAAGNIYIADKGNNAVKKLLAGGGIAQIIGSGFNSPEGVAVDANGNTYVADAGNNAVKKILAAGGAPITIGGGFSAPSGVAVDGSGNIFVADYGNNAVKEILAVGGGTVTLGSGFSHPSGVAVDGAGDVFVADAGNNLVKEIPAAGGAVITLTILYPGVNNPAGITIDGAGNLYIAGKGNNTVIKIRPIGGYFVNPFLPAGLSINASTGVISGTPVAGAAAATYTVTAWNFTGSASTTLRFSVDPVSSPPTLNYGNAQAGIATVPSMPFSPSGANIGNYGYNINYAAPIGSGLVNPVAVAADPQGNVYIGDDQAWINGQPGIVYEEPADGSGQQTAMDGLGDPTSLAATAGNLYISDTGNLEIFEGNLPYSSSPELSYIGPIAVDGDGNVYTFNPGFNALFKLPPDLSNESPFGSGLSSPVSIAADQAGNVYVSDAGNNNIVRFKPDGSGPFAVAPVNNPGAITLDPAGNIYVVDNKGNLFVVFAGTNYATLIASGLKNANSLAIDAKGNIYWADTGAHLVYKMAPIGGYFLGAPLPAGLIFSSINGSVSGTPAAASPAANYAVTAYNPNGSVTATFNLAVNPAPPPPSLSYSGPQTYTVNSAITPLSPVTNNTVASLAYRPFPVSIGSGFANPVGVATDGQGNIFIADDKADINAQPAVIYKEPADGSAQIAMQTGSEPTSLATDAAGNLYISDIGYTQISEIPVGQTDVSNSSPELDQIGPIAVDGAGNVYTFASGGSTIYKLPSDLSAESPFVSGLNSLVAIAADRAGNVYVSDAGNNNIVKFNPDGSSAGVLASVQSPGALTVDPAGNIYVINNQGNLYTIPAGTTAALQIGSGFNNASSLAIDGKGNIYYTDISSHLAKTISPSGGYFLNTPLPQGLSCPNTTGIISGTPTAISPTTNYTVTAYNIGGKTSATVNIKVAVLSANTYLSNLKINAGAIPLSPAFNYGTTSYSASVTNATTSIKLTPATADLNATVKINGTAVKSGTASAAIALNIGTNTIATVVTAQNGTSTKTYTITVTRAGSANTYLSNLKINAGAIPLSPAFNYATTTYTASVPNATTSVKVTPAIADANATVKINGTLVKSGTASAALPLKVGQNTINAIVTAQNGTSARLYALTVTRAPSANAGLAGLKLSSGALSPAFATGTTSYTATVNTASITVTPTTGDATAKVKINGTAVTSGAASQAIALTMGANTITTIVTAQDGATTNTYTITVTRLSNNANLANLKINAGAVPLTPAFNYAVTGYTASVPNATTSVKITPAASDANATITVNGVMVKSGTASAVINLNTGPNIINTVVTAQDGITTKTYTITVTRPSTDASLANLAISSGALSPAFASTTTSYTDYVSDAVTSVTITPTTTDAGATVTVNGTAVTSGTASGAIAVAVGPNTITIVVTAGDGMTTKTYTATVNRMNLYLTNLKINSGTIALTPAFHFTTTSYTASVPNATASIKVTPTLAYSGSTVTINGAPATSGTASGAIALVVGPNTINTVVTGADGLSTYTYTITVTRAAPGPMAEPLEATSVQKPVESPLPIAIGMEDDGLIVHQGISPNGDGVNDFLVIEGITNYPDNKLTVMNRNGMRVYEAKGYDNSQRVFDGHSNKTGALQLPGTYFYSLDYTVKGINKHKTGFIILKY